MRFHKKTKTQHTHEQKGAQEGTSVLCELWGQFRRNTATLTDYTRKLSFRETEEMMVLDDWLVDVSDVTLGNF